MAHADVLDREEALPEGTREVASAVARGMQWLAVAVALFLLSQVLHIAFTNENFEWSVVRRFFWSRTVLDGVLLTLLLTAVTMVIAVIFGTALALARMSSNAFLSACAGGYLWLIVSIPELVQLLFWYNIAALIPHVGIWIPFGPTIGDMQVTNFVTPLMAAVISFGLLETAYMSEIIRGGLLSVPAGQVEAAKSLGMSSRRTLLRVRLPQAMRFIVPPTANQVIRLVKGTSLVSVISLSDLLYSVQLIYNRTFQTIPLLMVACIWYLLINSVLGFVQYRLERHYGRGVAGSRARGLRPLGLGARSGAAKATDLERP